MGVHGDVAEDVVEDVGLGGVLHGVARAKPGCRGEHSRCKHLEEGVGREEAAYWCGLPASARSEAGADGFEVGQSVLTKAYLLEAFEILAAGMLTELGHAAADQFGPDGVLFRR